MSRKFFSPDPFSEGRVSNSPADNGLQEAMSAEQCPNSLEVGHSKTDDALSEKQLEVIEWLINGYSDARAAQGAGVDRRTIYRWRQDKQFMRELNRQREIALSEAADGLRSLLPTALGVIAEQMRVSGSEQAFRAASLLLKTGLARTLRSRRIDQED